MLSVEGLVWVIVKYGSFCRHLKLHVKNDVGVVCPQDELLSGQLHDPQYAIVPLQVVCRHPVHVVDSPRVHTFVCRVKHSETVGVIRNQNLVTVSVHSKWVAEVQRWQLPLEVVFCVNPAESWVSE